MKRGTSIHFNSTSSSDLTTSTFSNVAHISILSSPLDRDSSEALGRSSIFFKVQKLFDQLKIKITPVPLDPFSKKPSRAGWNAPDYDPNTYSWARHYGNVGIIPGRSSLLIIDCDNEKTVDFFMKLAEEINLPVDTLIVQTRRGKHFYYYCPFSNELDKKQFSYNDIKLDILAGNKCQAVAPFSTLKLDKNGNILDPKATDYILFEYTPINIPSKLVEVSREKYETLLVKLEKKLEKNKKTLHLPPYVEKTENEKELTDEEIEKLIEIINEHFTEGQRQNLILYLSGYLRKELNVSEESIYKLYEQLQPADDPRDRKARIAAIKKTFEKDSDRVAGWAGLVELLGEETARELCNKTKKALNLQDKEKDKEPLVQTQTEEEKYVFVELNRKAKKYARCNFNKLCIEVGAYEKNELIDEYFFVVQYKALACCIEKIYVIENPLTGEENFEVHFISKNLNKPKATVKGNLQEIWEQLRTKTTYVLDVSRGLNILTAVLQHYFEKGWFEKKKEELPPGFYYFDNQLIAHNFEEKDYTKEDLQKAALFLNEYIYSHPNPALIASIIRAGLLLPFSFAQKQLVTSGKLRKRMKYLFLTGETKSGKTTTALLLQRIWSWDYEINYASFNTESRAGKHLSSSTFPVVVNEVAKEFEQNLVKELLKHAQEGIMARIIQSRALKTIQYPALAPVVMTSNVHFPEDPALVERFIIFRFRKNDKISSANRARYEREDFKILEPLGQFVWQHIKEHGLKDDYINYTVEILRAFYKEAEVDAEWLDWEFKDDTSETEEEQVYNREIEFFTAVQKFFNNQVKPKEQTLYARCVYDALKMGQFGRWIWVDENNFVYISKDFLIELKKYYKCNVRDLEELSDLTGWEKKQKRCEKNDKKTTIWVVSTSVTEFFHRLNYIPRPMNSLEFEEYLANRLPKDSIPF